MKGLSITSLILAALLLLPACGNVQPEESSAFSWTSEGRAYKAEALNMPDDYFQVFFRGEDCYVNAFSIGFDTPNSYSIVKNATETLYTPQSGSIDCMDGDDEGIWFVETGTRDGAMAEELKLLSYSGDMLKTIPLSDIAAFSSSVDTLCCLGGNVYLKSPDRLVALDSSGEKLFERQTPAGAGRMVVGGDGKLYVGVDTDTGRDIMVLEGKDFKKAFSLSENGSILCGGNDEFPLLLADPGALCGLSADGKTEKLIVWTDCNISVSRVRSVIPMSEDRFLVVDGLGASVVTPAAPADMTIGRTLTMAVVANPEHVAYPVKNFNQLNTGYYIEIADYSQNGAVDRDTAITRLKTDMISGKSPDLILFNDLSPYSYINKGYLADMCALMESDPDLSLDNIAIADQLKVGDGIYFMDNYFTINTLEGLSSRFGDSFGWTLQDYLDYEADAPKGQETMYNMTVDTFLTEVCSRYLQKAVNWQDKTCDFDNAEFASILDAASRIKENPEPTDMALLNMTPGSIRLKEGSLIVTPNCINSVSAHAKMEKEAGGRLSTVGWPTADGSCGSDISIEMPVGICAQSKNIDGAWSYVKYLVINAAGGEGALPVYKPWIEAAADIALKEEQKDGLVLTQEDVDRFWELLSQIKTVGLYDDTIINIIKSEAAPFLAGQKTAQETAKIIQSKVSLCIAEQG